jgi:hypothetical protein
MVMCKRALDIFLVGGNYNRYKLLMNKVKAKCPCFWALISTLIPIGAPYAIICKSTRSKFYEIWVSKVVGIEHLLHKITQGFAYSYNHSEIVYKLRFKLIITTNIRSKKNCTSCYMSITGCSLLLCRGWIISTELIFGFTLVTNSVRNRSYK